MSQRQVPGPSKKRGSGKNVSAPVTSSSRRRGGGVSSSIRSDRPQLPVSSSGRVLATNPAVLQWLTRSSTSSQGTSVTPSQESVGTSDTTLSWHGPGTSSVPPPLLNLPLTFSAPSAREVLCALGSDPLFSEDELREDSQQLHNSQNLASSSRLESSDDETLVGAHVRGADMRLVEDDDDYDDDVADRTWEPGEQRASSSSSSSSSSGDDDQVRMAQRLSQQGPSVAVSQQGPSVAVSQQGGRNVRCGAKRARGTPSAPQEPTCPETPSVGGVHTFSGRQSAGGGGGSGKKQFSAVWEFFIKSPEDISVAMCRMCTQKVKRGQGSNVGTTALRQHMERHHKVAWENRGKNVVVQPEASPSGPRPFFSSQGSTTSVEGSCGTLSTCTAPAAPPPTPTKSFRQQSITEAIEKRQQYASTHPTAQKMNALLAKLLVLQSLPFHVVDSHPFRQLMACAEPRWRVPSRHFFSKKAIPALHTYVEQKVGQSLSLSVCGKVHATADVWSCNYGQGQYMAFTAHWVNVVSDQSHQPLCQVTAMPPPRSPAAFPAPMSSSASSTLSSASTAGTTRSGPPAYHLCRAQRCHAVLHLVCLGERSHTGEELLRVIRQEIASWLSPRKLKIGNVVTDNGTNIVSALRQGGLSHAPCMAHVFNLIVKSFLKSSTQLHNMLKMARKLCMHFSHSYTAKHALLELQRQNAIPQHRLICDVSTRWNSTLHMLDRLYEQRKAVNDFLMMQADRSTPLCNFDVSQWQLMRDTCRLLRPFEEATLFVSRQDYAVNDVIPLLHILEQMLVSISGQGTGDVAPTCHRHLSPGGAELEEEEEEDINAQEMYTEMGDLSGQVTGEEQEEQEEDEEEQADDPDTPWQYAVEMEAGSPSESLVQMATCMLTCLRSDRRIINIRQRDDYWLATMLDPRFRSRMESFFPPAQIEDKLSYFRDLLCTKLVAAHVRHRPSSRTSDSGGPLRSSSTAMTAGRGVGASSRTSSTSSTFSLESLMQNFLHPPTEETRQQQQQQQDMEQTLHQQVVAYLEATLHTAIKDPLDYWAAKLDLWPQLAEFALEKLSCPCSSVASERVFSAAGGIVTQKRSRLATKNVERLTFVKMNQEWITKDFHTPVPDASD